jgi:hypothetical protein
LEFVAVAVAAAVAADDFEEGESRLKNWNLGQEEDAFGLLESCEQM